MMFKIVATAALALTVAGENDAMAAEQSTTTTHTST